MNVELSTDLTDFQLAIADIFFDEREAMRGKFLNPTDAIIDHGSMMQYDASRDWTKTAPAMESWDSWNPTKQEQKFCAVVSSAEVVKEHGIGVFGHIRNQIGLMTVMKAASDTRIAPSSAKSI